jgi:hypothetical protein
MDNGRISTVTRKETIEREMKILGSNRYYVRNFPHSEARGSLVVEALCYKQEGSGFELR